MASYPPGYHTQNDEAVLFDAIEAIRHATLLVSHQGRNLVAFTPFLLDRERRVLRGHVSHDNPQAAAMDQHPVDVIFHGPHAYISPQLNGNSGVPTWNYVNVHVHGKARVIDDEETAWNMLRELTAVFEGANAAAFLAAEEDALRRMLPGIRVVEIGMDEINGRFKISRNKPPELQRRAFEALRAETPPSLRDWMEILAPPPS